MLCLTNDFVPDLAGPRSSTPGTEYSLQIKKDKHMNFSMPITCFSPQNPEVFLGSILLRVIEIGVTKQEAKLVVSYKYQKVTRKIRAGVLSA